MTMAIGSDLKGRKKDGRKRSTNIQSNARNNNGIKTTSRTTRKTHKGAKVR